MDFVYVATPFVTWIVAGGLKFLINTLRSGRLAFRQIGYGGMPSNHSAIISSAVFQVGLQEGIYDPAFGVGLAIAFIVALDASSLRRELGRHAQLLNTLSSSAKARLRERMGHTPLEILTGFATGGAIAWGLNILLDTYSH